MSSCREATETEGLVQYITGVNYQTRLCVGINLIVIILSANSLIINSYSCFAYSSPFVRSRVQSTTPSKVARSTSQRVILCEAWICYFSVVLRTNILRNKGRSNETRLLYICLFVCEFEYNYLERLEEL